MSRVILYLLSAVVLAAAFLFPETHISAFCGLVSTALLALALRSGPTRLTHFFLFGVLLHAIAFYWLPETVGFFGGFPQPIALCIFALFCVTAALQFVLCGWLYRHLASTRADRFLLAFPTAWFVSETVFPRLFPWHLAHTIINWPLLAGAAAYGGVLPLTFVVAWLGAAGTEAGRLLLKRPASRGAITASVLTALGFCLLGYLHIRETNRQLSSAPKVSVGLIQGNLAAKQKGNVRYFDVNLQRYRELSQVAVNSGAEILFWPESVVNHWMNEAEPTVTQTALEPVLSFPVPLLYGGLGFRELTPAELKPLLEAHPEYRTAEAYDSIRTKRFNSGFMLNSNGEFVGRYHKRVLMPFGEYMPFADVFPGIKALSPMTGEFTKGDLLEPLKVSVTTADNAVVEVLAGTLICYEDLVPALSADAALRGANLLVNITNDAWYGRTAAPYQHHLLAQWRAIETRRYLLRVTNTGYSAIVDPFGKTFQSLPIFTEGTLVAKVSLLSGQTFYTRVGSLPLVILSWALIAVIFVRGRLVRRGSFK